MKQKIKNAIDIFLKLEADQHKTLNDSKRILTILESLKQLK